MRLKEQYIGKRVTHNGITYDLSNMNAEKLYRVWETNITLRYLFEEIDPFDLPELTEEEQFFQNKPEDKTEEEFFNETIKKATKRTKKKKENE